MLFVTLPPALDYPLATDAGWPASGHVRINLAGNDPAMVAPCCISYGANAPTLSFRAADRIAHPTGFATGQIFWQTFAASGFNEARSYRYPMVAVQQFSSSELHLSRSSTDTSLLTQLPFDPARSDQKGNDIDID